jgi:hypothetical protein
VRRDLAEQPVDMLDDEHRLAVDLADQFEMKRRSLIGPVGARR